MNNMWKNRTSGRFCRPNALSCLCAADEGFRELKGSLKTSASTKDIIGGLIEQTVQLSGRATKAWRGAPMMWSNSEASMDTEKSTEITGRTLLRWMGCTCTLCLLRCCNSSRFSQQHRRSGHLVVPSAGVLERATVTLCQGECLQPVWRSAI